MFIEQSEIIKICLQEQYITNQETIIILQLIMESVQSFSNINEELKYSKNNTTGLYIVLQENEEASAECKPLRGHVEFPNLRVMEGLLRSRYVVDM